MAGGAIIVEKDSGAGRDESARAGVARGDADSAGAPPQRQQQQLLQLLQQPEAGAAAPAAVPAQMEARAVAQVETMEDDERPTSAEPHVAAAA
mgnify:CR=1 FL=1